MDSPTLPDSPPLSVLEYNKCKAESAYPEIWGKTYNEYLYWDNLAVTRTGVAWVSKELKVLNKHIDIHIRQYSSWQIPYRYPRSDIT